MSALRRRAPRMPQTWRWGGGPRPRRRRRKDGVTPRVGGTPRRRRARFRHRRCRVRAGAFSSARQALPRRASRRRPICAAETQRGRLRRGGAPRRRLLHAQEVRRRTPPQPRVHDVRGGRRDGQCGHARARRARGRCSASIRHNHAGRVGAPAEAVRGAVRPGALPSCAGAGEQGHHEQASAVAGPNASRLMARRRRYTAFDAGQARALQRSPSAAALRRGGEAPIHLRATGPPPSRALAQQEAGDELAEEPGHGREARDDSARWPTGAEAAPRTPRRSAPPARRPAHREPPRSPTTRARARAAIASRAVPRVARAATGTTSRTQPHCCGVNPSLDDARSVARLPRASVLVAPSHLPRERHTPQHEIRSLVLRQGQFLTPDSATSESSPPAAALARRRHRHGDRRLRLRRRPRRRPSSRATKAGVSPTRGGSSRRARLARRCRGGGPQRQPPSGVDRCGVQRREDDVKGVTSVRGGRPRRTRARPSASPGTRLTLRRAVTRSCWSGRSSTGTISRACTRCRSGPDHEPFGGARSLG